MKQLIYIFTYLYTIYIYKLVWYNFWLNYLCLCIYKCWKTLTLCVTYVRVCTRIFPLFEHTLLTTYIVAGHGKMKIDDVFHHRVQRVHFRCNCSAFKHKCRRKVQSESTVNNSEWVFESQCEWVWVRVCATVNHQREMKYKKCS